MQPHADETLIRELASLVAQFTRAFRLLERDEQACYGVTVSQCCAILAIRQRGEMTMNELADALAVATSTATRIVDNLVENGTIERDRDTRDRRIVIVRLSPEGTELSKKLDECTCDYFAEIVAEIPVERREQALESLRLLVGAVRVR